ncbi:MAG: hypothetical protein K8H74_18055 [Notoacmeibacter sp.]|nr:hypothetical protein [Notoacmeibacter sp.]
MTETREFTVIGGALHWRTASGARWEPVPADVQLEMANAWRPLLDVVMNAFERRLERLERGAAEEAAIAKLLRSPGLELSYAAEAARLMAAA